MMELPHTMLVFYCYTLCSTTHHDLDKKNTSLAHSGSMHKGEVRFLYFYNSNTCMKMMWYESLY